jgi:hypothetical protein
MAMGAWMIVSPQAVLGLDQLKWMYKYSFPGEVLLGALLMTGSLQLLTPIDVAGQISPGVQRIPPSPESTSTPTRLT